jgi:hypothetical protein
VGGSGGGGEGVVRMYLLVRLVLVPLWSLVNVGAENSATYCVLFVFIITETATHFVTRRSNNGLEKHRS